MVNLVILGHKRFEARGLLFPYLFVILRKAFSHFNKFTSFFYLLGWKVSGRGRKSA